jgi:hypothetical protein
LLQIGKRQFCCHSKYSTSNSGNTIAAIPPPDETKIIKVIELALAPALPVASIKVRKMVYDVIAKYEVQLSINNNIATVVVNAVRYRLQLGLDNQRLQSVKEVEQIGNFKMELGIDGLPEKNVVKLANYLISLIKGHPPNTTPTNICLTNTMTKQQVIQLFKQAIGKTDIDDILIGLPQAEERQKILDYVDLFFADKMFKENSFREFTNLAQLVGSDELYGRLICVLTSKSLKLQKTTFGPDSTANGTYNTRNNTLKCELVTTSEHSIKISDAKTLIHELLHAYVDIISGKPLGPKQDEAMAHGLEKGYFSSSTGIYSGLYKIENYMDNNGDLATAVSMWNKLVNSNPPGQYGGRSIIEDVMTDETYQYKSWGQTYAPKYTKDDFRRIQEYTGFGLSHARLKQVAQYLNEKYNTNLFQIQKNTTSY